jgi:hypothetical protein
VAAGVVAAGADALLLELAAQPAVNAAMASTAGTATRVRLTPGDELFNRASLRAEETLGEIYGGTGRLVVNSP